MAPDINLRDQILRGLRERADIPINERGLVTLQGARMTEDGVRPYPTINTESNIDALTESWPFPQLFRYMDRTVLIKGGNTPPVDVDESVSPWTLANMSVVDKHGDAQTPTAGGIYHVANFGAFVVLTNGTQILFNKAGAAALQMAPTQVKSVCNYKNSQLIMAGLGPSTLWPTVLKNFIKWRQAFDPSYPLPGGELATEVSDDLEQWIWWSSVGGGDAFMLMDPHELLLPAYSDILLEVDNIVNGKFGTDTTGWNLGTGWTRASNQIVATAATGNFGINVATGYDPDPENQKYYSLSFTWTRTSGTCYIKAGNWESENIPTADGRITMPIYFDGDPDDATAPLFEFIPLTDSPFTGTIDNINMLEIVKHKQDYNQNVPRILQYGDMKDADSDLIESAWEGGDGLSSWSVVPKSSVVTNGNMYAAGDADDSASRATKMFNPNNWLRTQGAAANYLTHGYTHDDELLAIQQEEKFVFGAWDDDEEYDVTVYTTSRTAGSYQVRFGLGTGFDGRVNISDAIEGNGSTTILRMQTDTDPTSTENVIDIVPTDDFDGKVFLVHAERHVDVIEDTFAMETVTDHTNLTQLSASMNSAVIPGNRYRVKWKQMSYTPEDIVRFGQLIVNWNVNDIELGSRPVGGIASWSAENGTVPWFGTSNLNILSNSLWYLSQTFGWTIGGNWAYNAGTEEMDHTPGATANIVQLPARMWFAPVDARTYTVVVRVTNTTAGTVSFRLGVNDMTTNNLDVTADGWHVGTILADNGFASWDSFYIAPSSDFDGSVQEVMLLDLTQDTEDNNGLFEVYAPGAHLLSQDETFMHCHPLQPTKNYELKWTYDQLDAQTITPYLGGQAGTARSSPGTYTESIVCDSSTATLHFASSATGSARIQVDYLKPGFTEGVRPILATEEVDVSGTSTYFSNGTDREYEDFLRTIRVPAAPANLDLEFEFEYGIMPTRITDVEIEPLDTEIAVLDMQPKPVIFDYFDRNEAGFAPFPFPGTPLRVLQLGEHVMCYGTNAVGYYSVHTEPFHSKVAHPLPGYPPTMGVASEGACMGDENEHLFVDERGMLWHVARGAVPIVERLDYQEFFTPLLGNDIVITRDQETRAWRISDGVVSYYWRDGRLSQAPEAVTFLEFEGGGLVGNPVTLVEGDPEFILLTDQFDAGDRGKLKEIFMVQVIGRGEVGSYSLGPELIEDNRTFDSDLSDWTQVINDWAWQTGGFARCSADAVGDILRYDNFTGVASADYQTRLVIGGAPGGGSIKVGIGATVGTPRSTAGTFIETLAGVTASPFDLIPSSVPVSTLDVDEVSVRQYRAVGAGSVITPFLIYVDAMLHETGTWTRFGPFTPDSQGMAITKVLGVHFRIMVESGNGNLVELDDIAIDVRTSGKRSIFRWINAFES